jgi:hypothetical protein
MSLLNKLNDFVVETSEQAVKVVEEGTSLLFKDGVDDGGANNDLGNDKLHTGTIDMDEPSFSEEDLNFESPLNGIADGVLGDILQKQVGPQNAWENVQAFRSAICWTEPFILSLLAFHILMTSSIIYSVKRGGSWSQIILLGFIFFIVRMAERLNDFGSQHWESIATQDYFDSGGVFISIMVSAPLLLMTMAMLMCFVKEAAGLLVLVKKHELKSKAKKKKDAQSANAGKVKRGKKDD